MALVVCAYVIVSVLVVFGYVPLTALIVAVTLPEAVRLIKRITSTTETALLHQAQGRTAKLHGDFGLWLVIGWLAWLALDLVI